MEEIKQGYKQTDIGVIPNNWEISTVDQIIKDISMGPFGSDIKVSNFVSEGVPVLNGYNVSGRRLIEIFSNYVTEEKARSLKKAVAKKGDIVITHRGTIGQVSFIPYSNSYEYYVISQSQFKITVNDKKVDPEYFVLYFHSNAGQSTIHESKGHTGVPAIAQPTTTFRKFNLPIPPLKEQILIVEKLNNIEKLITALDKKIAKKSQIKQGAMQQLLTGKKRLPGFSEEWVESKLVTGLKFQTGDPFSSTFFNANKQGIRLIKNRDLKSDDQIIYYSGTYTNDFIVDNGDVLIGMDGDFLPCIWNKGTALLNQRVGRLLVKSLWNSIFLFYYLYNPLKDLQEATGATTVKHLAHKDIEEMVLPIPPTYEEQTAIAQILTDMDNEITQLEKERDKYVQLKAGMMQVLLTGKIRICKI